MVKLPRASSAGTRVVEWMPALYGPSASRCRWPLCGHAVAASPTAGRTATVMSPSYQFHIPYVYLYTSLLLSIISGPRPRHEKPAAGRVGRVWAYAVLLAPRRLWNNASV